MVRIKWHGQSEPAPGVSQAFQDQLASFIQDKVMPLKDEIDRENGFFDISDADNPSQLSIVPKEFSPELTKKILNSFAG
jgi:hypothetical protein